MSSIEPGDGAERPGGEAAPSDRSAPADPSSPSDPSTTRVNRSRVGQRVRQPTDVTSVVGEPIGRPDTGPVASATPRTRMGGPAVAREALRRSAAPIDGLETPVALLELPGERPFDRRNARRDGKYLLGAVLGEGGMGVVMAARDVDLGRTVALKTLRDTNKSDAAMIRALLFEARIAGQLEHPHIVPVHAVGVLEDGRVYYTMKLVGDLSLKDVLAQLRDGNEFARETYTLPRLLQYFRGICMAVQYAHARGVVHRDLKPDNVLIGGYGEVQIMDWGIARVLPREPGEPGLFAGAREEPGLIAGTPHYMSPEQARGDTDLVDERSDVYSLGVILYQLLTYTLPFATTTTQDQLDALLTKQAPPPSVRAPEREIPPELERICLGALHHDRDARYPSAMLLWGDIEAYLEGKKEQERLLKLATEQADTAAEATARYDDVHRRTAALRARVREDERSAGYFDALRARKAAWDRRLRLDHLELLEARAFAEAVAGYHQALAYQPRFAAAVDGLSALYRSRAADAHQAGDAATLVQYTELARSIERRPAEKPVRLPVRSYPEGATIRIFELQDAGRFEAHDAIDSDVAPAVFRLPAGSYVISAQLPGYRETREPVVLEPSGSPNVLITLRPWSASLPRVGHADELTAIKDAFATCSAEERASTMLVHGAGGLGKGKLVAEFDRFLDDLPDTVFFGHVQCAPLHRHVPFHAFSALLRHRFGVGVHDAPDVVRERMFGSICHALTDRGAQAMTPALRAEAEELRDKLARVPGMGAGGPDTAAAREDPRVILDAIVQVFGRLARLHPLVLMIRGADNLDRPSRDLLVALVERLSDRPLFVLAFARSQAVPLAVDRMLEVRPLDRDAVHRQLSMLLRGPVSPELVSLVVARTRGNPFHIGQLTRHLHDAGWLERDGARWDITPDPEARTALAQLTVRDVLLQPLHQLPRPAQEVLARAASCGRTFWAGQLEAVCGRPVYDELMMLADADIVARSPVSRVRGHQEFHFRFEGLQQLLAERAGPEVRREVHETAATWLQRSGTRGLELSALLATHLASAGRPAEAEALRAALAAEAARWEAPEAPPLERWPEDDSPGLRLRIRRDADEPLSLDKL